MKKTAKMMRNLALALALAGFGFASCQMDDNGGSSSNSQQGMVFGTAVSQNLSAFAETGPIFPEPDSEGVFEDSRFYITFDAEPILSDEILVVICDAETDEYVDFLSMEETTDYLSDGANSAKYRISDGSTVEGLNLKRFNVQKDGNQIVIIPHSDTLKAGKKYYILIDDGTFIGKIGGEWFKGFAAHEWEFTVRDSYTPTDASNIRVALVDEDADYRTVQGALKAAADNAVITVEPGVYKEIVWYAQKGKNITIIGNGIEKYGRDVVIQGWNGNKYNPSTQGRAAFYFAGGSLTLKNITIQNPYDRNVDGTAQSEALHYQGGKNLVAYNCSFLGYQDTILTNGKNWFYQCYVEGDTDFIWGTADVALFEECSIKQLNTSGDKVKATASYIFETRVGNINSDTVGKGYILLNCDVNSAHPKSFFARRASAKTYPTTYYDQVAIINCTFTGTPNAELWSGANAGGNEPEFVEKDEQGNMNVGWKVYGGSGYPTAKIDAYPYFGTITKEVYEAEYSGRNVIFNKVYNKAEKSYEVNSSKFDTAKYESELGFTATEDTSELSGEEAVPGANGTYNFVNGEDGTFTTSDGNITVTTSEKNNGGHGVTTAAGAKIAVKVAGMAKITVYGCQFMAGGNVTITDQAGTELGTIVTKVSSCGTGVDFVYTGSEPNVITFTFSAKECIHGIAVKNLKGIVKVSSITISGGSEVEADDVLELSATVTPSDAVNKAVEWSSSDEDVASVKDGVVSAKKAGTVTISATAKDGSGVKGTKTITVKASSVVEDTSFNPEKAEGYEWNFLGEKMAAYKANATKGLHTYGILTMNVDKGWCTANGTEYGYETHTGTLTLKAKGNVEVSVANSIQGNHYTVASTKGSLSAKKIDVSGNGTTSTVYCLYDGTDEYEITLTACAKNYLTKVAIKPVASDKIVKVSRITVTGSTDTVTAGLGSVSLSAAVEPSNALIKTVSWSSSDDKIATVDENGKVTPKNAGTVTITARASDGSGVYGTKEITVKADENIINSEWDFLGSEKATYGQNITASTDYIYERLTVNFASGSKWIHANNGNAYQANAGTTFKFRAKGSVSISVSNSYNGNHYKVTTTNGKLSASEINSSAAGTDSIICRSSSNSEYIVTLEAVVPENNKPNYPTKLTLKTVPEFNPEKSPYEWDFLGAKKDDFAAAVKGASYSDDILTINFVSSKWLGGSHAYALGKGSSFKIEAKGNVKVTVYNTANTNEYAVATSAGTLSTEKIAGKGRSDEFTCTNDSDESYTITLTADTASGGQQYPCKITIESIN